MQVLIYLRNGYLQWPQKFNINAIAKLSILIWSCPFMFKEVITPRLNIKLQTMNLFHPYILSLTQ